MHVFWLPNQLTALVNSLMSFGYTIRLTAQMNSARLLVIIIIIDSQDPNVTTPTQLCTPLIRVIINITMSVKLDHNGLTTRQSNHPALLAECCFTSTETVGFLGTGSQDGHLDFHTAHEHPAHDIFSQCCL